MTNTDGLPPSLCFAVASKIVDVPQIWPV